MKNIQRIYVILATWGYLGITSLFAAEGSIDAKNKTIYEGLTQGIGKGSVVASEKTELGLLDAVFKFAKDSISGLLMLIAIGVFLYIGIKLATARGNPEEFKKAWMQFIYAVIGIFIVSAAWAIVKLVAGINL